MRDPFIKIPFAFSGDKTSIPTATQPDGSISMQQGWGNDYTLEVGVDPAAKSVDRQHMNQIFNLATALLNRWQTETFPEWIDSAANDGVPFAYPIGSVVRYSADGIAPYLSWVNLTDDNTTSPSVVNGWILLTDALSLAKDPTLTERGAPFLASDADVIEGLDPSKMVSPSNLSPALKAVSGIFGQAKNLICSASGTNSLVSVKAGQIFVENSGGRSFKLRNVDRSINTSTIGADGLDSGALATNTWYSVWVISDGVNSRGLISLSATSPALPVGYTYKARVGWIRTDASANKYPLSFIQSGNNVAYKPVAGSNLANYPVIASGTLGTTSALVPVSISGVVPPTAVEIKLQLGGGTSSNSMAAPSAAFTGGYSGISSPPLNSVGSTSTNFNISGSFMLESSSVYYFSQGASGVLQCSGWSDDL